MKNKFLAVLCGFTLAACGSTPEKKAEPVAAGGEKEMIRRVVASHAGEIQKCYSAELRNTPTLQGKVVAGWIIAKDGTVDKSWIKSSTVGSPALEDCLIQQINLWQFGAPPDGKKTIDVSYPFVFKLPEQTP